MYPCTCIQLCVSANLTDDCKVKTEKNKLKDDCEVKTEKAQVHSKLLLLALVTASEVKRKHIKVYDYKYTKHYTNIKLVKKVNINKSF